MADLKIDRTLNLVIPSVDENDKVVAYVHHRPISREVYETYYRVMARAFDAVLGIGRTGPLVAHLTLCDEAKRAGEWDGEAGVKNGLVGEIRRLTNVVLPGPRGWQTVPYDEAVKRGALSADDAAEVDNAIAFFTLASHVPAKRDRPGFQMSSKLWGAHTTSSDCTAFAAGLPIPIAAASTEQQKEAVAKTASSIAS